MDVISVVMLVVGLACGALGGALAAWLVRRARTETEVAKSETYAARHRGDLAQAQSLAAQARSEADRARTETAQARADMHRAREEASDVRAAMAEIRAEAGQARAERDGALQRAAEIAKDREAMLNQFKVLSSESLERQGKQADVAAEHRLRATEQLMAPVRQSLDTFNNRLTEVEKERVRLSTDLKSQVQSVQQTGEHLRRETSALTTALRKPHVRGAWGEMQLKRVVELAGMLEHCDFTLQHTTSTDGTAIRPDLRVDLSDGKCLFVDAKVPLSAFLDAYETDDEDERRRGLERFANNVKTHVDQLGQKKYWQAETHSPEFVVLFLPNEALAAEAFELLPDLNEYAARRDIVLATPTTLIAMLRAVAYGWKQAQLAQNAAEVLQLGRSLHDRLATLGGHYDKLGRSIAATVKAYNATLGSLEGRVMVSARRFRDLNVTDAELAAIGPVEESMRQLSDGELIEDAVQIESVVGRTRGRAPRELPEGAELVRGEPGLFEIETDAPDDQPQRRRRNA